MDGINRRDFSKSVGLFAGYVALGGPKALFEKPLIVTPDEYVAEAALLGGNVPAAVARGEAVAVAVLDRKGKMVGITKFTCPAHIDIGDTLNIDVNTSITCLKCGHVHYGTILSQSFGCM